MPGPAPRLPLTSSEQLILEAAAASPDIPERVQKRARIILLSANGVSNSEIGRQVDLARARVLFWRERYSQQGIEGLWDRERVPPKSRIPRDRERGIIQDCLYRERVAVSFLELPDASLTWNVRSLALRHDVSHSSVQRILRKHGVRMARWRLDHGIELQELKISTDPWFGLDYCGMGLFYETVGPFLALCQRPQRLSDIAFSNMSAEARENVVDEVVMRFRRLSPRNVGPTEGSTELFINFLEWIAQKAGHDGRIDLIVQLYEWRYCIEPISKWIQRHGNVRLVHTPVLYEKCWKRSGRRIVHDWDKGRLPAQQALRERWVDFIHRILTVISKWPLQTALVSDLFRITQRLREIRTGQSLDTISIS